ncbi:Cullin repeat-like-containing domain protein [Melampsora americana]|nr:Cullin repeat-like-containing domain protein [Melampsora americana]
MAMMSFHDGSSQTAIQTSSLDQSAADIILLSTSLGKSKKITDKLSKMLTGFDDRLSRLEKSLAPIHSDTRTLTRINTNIEKTLNAVDQVLGNHDAALRQQIVIKNGPDPENLAVFTHALDEIAKSASELTRTGAGDKGSFQEIEDLLASGAEKLVAIFVGWAKGVSEPLVDANSYMTEGVQFPSIPSSTALPSCLEHSKKLKGILTDSVNKYAEIRGTYVAESMRPTASETIESVRKGAGASALANFIECLFHMLQEEYAMLISIFEGNSTKEMKEIFSKVVPAPLELLSETGQSVNRVVKSSLTSYVSAAFDNYEAIYERLDRYDDEIRRRSGRKENELGELLHSFKGSCLRSLPEYIADAKTFGEKAPTGSEVSNTHTCEMVINMIEYLKMLCSHIEITESFLITLGDGNWIFPSASGTAGRSNVGEGVDGQELLMKLPTSVQTTITSTTAKNGLGAVFVFNNLNYIRREVLESAISDILGKSIEDELNKRVRACKVRYMEVWSPLISALMDAGGDDSKGFGLGAVKSALPGQQAGAERRDVKDRFGRFNDAFEEVVNLHKVAQFDKSDSEVRERLRDEIERMIMPKFTQRHEGGQFSKNPSKYLKLTADQLGERLDRLFQ